MLAPNDVHSRFGIHAYAYYRPELDWLRFAAFTAVFLAHTCPLTTDPYTQLGIPRIVAQEFAALAMAGGYGVDLFFALSSFLITELLLLEKERTGKVHVKSFYIRRMLRIWPLYFVFVLLAFPFETALKTAAPAYYLAMLAFAGNLYIVYQGVQVFSVCAHLWSISVEEQFYIAWPNLVGRASPRRFALSMVLLFLFTLLYRVYYVLGDPPSGYAVWFHTLTRLDAFALGGLTACLLHNKRFVLARHFRFAFLAGALLIFSFLGARPDGAHYGIPTIWSYPLVAFASVLCILALICAPARQVHSRPFQALAYLGKISYGLYVFHVISIWFTDNFIVDGFVPARWIWVCRAIVAALATLLLAIVSYECLERPFLRLKRRFAYVQSRPE